MRYLKKQSVILANAGIQKHLDSRLRGNDTTTEKSQGFTLVELMITLVLMGVLAMLTIPNFERFYQKKQETTYITHLKQTLEFAHVYALEHHTPVTICPTDNDQTCTDSWNRPLILFTPKKILLIFQAPPHTDILTAALFPNSRWIQLQPEGLNVQTSGNLTLTNQATSRNMQLILSNTGKIRIIPENS